MGKGPIRLWLSPGQMEGHTMVDAALWYALGGHGMGADDLVTCEGADGWVGRFTVMSDDAQLAAEFLSEEGWFGLTAAETADLIGAPYVVVGGDSYGFGFVVRFADVADRDVLYRRHADTLDPREDWGVNA